MLILTATAAFAQDVIVKKDNSTVLSKVLEVSSAEIKYKKWSNQDGPTYTISVNEVLSINYQNGEIDKFDTTPAPQQQTPQQYTPQTTTTTNNNIVSMPTTSYKPEPIYGGYMRRSGSTLTLDGRTLSDNEVRKLVGEENYKTYTEAKSQIAAGDAWSAMFWISLIGFGLCEAGYSSTGNSTLAYSAIGLFVFNDVCLVCSLVFDGIGRGRMNWVADEYNRQHGRNYSLNFAPSIMECKTPQLQNNYGFGLTMSLSF